MSTKRPFTSDDFFKKYGPLTFGKLLNSHRITEEISQTDFAKSLGISRANLCDLEKGRKLPSFARAAKIAKLLKHDPRFFIQIALEDMLRREKLKFKVTVEAA